MKVRKSAPGVMILSLGPRRRKVSMEKVYLGDSVYVDYDGELFVLTTENGQGVTNEIWLKDTVVASFFRYIEQVYKAKITTDTVPGEIDEVLKQV